MYYFIEKMGVYAHGVFWIGKDLDEAKREADRLASVDSDAYHDWNVKLFDDHACADANNDPTHRVIYKGVRT
jgi:hypothetical protein